MQTQRGPALLSLKLVYRQQGAKFSQCYLHYPIPQSPRELQSLASSERLLARQAYRKRLQLLAQQLLACSPTLLFALKSLSAVTGKRQDAAGGVIASTFLCLHIARLRGCFCKLEPAD